MPGPQQTSRAKHELFRTLFRALDEFVFLTVAVGLAFLVAKEMSALEVSMLTPDFCGIIFAAFVNLRIVMLDSLGGR